MPGVKELTCREEILIIINGFEVENIDNPIMYCMLHNKIDVSLYFCVPEKHSYSRSNIPEGCSGQGVCLVNRRVQVQSPHR